MKNKIILSVSVAVLLMMNSIKSNAQNVELGFRFMPTISSFNFNNSFGGQVKGTVMLGYGFGGFLGVNFTKHIGLQGELIYSSIMQKHTDHNSVQVINLQYINIPVLLSLNTDKSAPVNLNFVAGPQVGLSVGKNIRTIDGDGTTTTQAVLLVKKGDLGFAYGAGLDFGIEKNIRLGIGFRGVYGLIDISDNNRINGINSYYLFNHTHIKTYSGYIGLSFVL